MRKDYCIKELTMSRTTGAGGFPAYSITLGREDRIVHWFGEEAVRYKGADEWRVSQRQFDRLEEAVKRVAYREMPLKKQGKRIFVDETEPFYVLTIAFEDGKTKEYKHFERSNAVPKDLFRLENRIDEILGTYKFVGHEK